jgi:phage baseplate assembly protein V
MFFDIAELKRKLYNLVRLSKVVTPNADGKALATVQMSEDDESIEFPVISFANSFKKHWVPIRANEQVLVVFPFGNANKGYIFRGIFWTELKEPAGANNKTEIIEYEDGARLTYNTETSALNVIGVKVVEIESADSIVLKSKKIVLDGEVETTRSLKVAETISDKKGDLTNHKHSVSDHTIANPR